jgi:mannose-1-phosphate guanylyltransferase
LETAACGLITANREKPTSAEEITTDTINAGIYLIDAALLDRIPRDRPVSIEREFFPGLIADGVPTFGWLGATYWRDIGNPAAYHAAQVDLLQARVRTELEPPGRPREGAWLGEGVEVAAGAVVQGPCVVGAGVRLGDGARVGPLAVLGDGVQVAAGARVERAVLWEGVEVGAGAALEGCVVGAHARIGAGAAVGTGVALESGAVVPAAARVR